MTDTTTPALPASALREWLETFKTVAIALAIALVLRVVIFQPFTIPSSSMEPGLVTGDYIVVSKFSYGWSRASFPLNPPLFKGRFLARTAQRGDVVVFRLPRDPSQTWIKRVIGLPGDSVQVVNGQVVLNGKAIPKQKVADLELPITPNFTNCPALFQGISGKGDPVCKLPRFRETLPGGKTYDVLDQGLTPQDNTEVFHVPAGHVFLMGDNRDNSTDSRFAQPPEGQGIAYVPLENLEGKAVLSFWSTDGSANWFLPWTWFTAARWGRIGEGF